MTLQLTRTQYVDAAGGHTVSLASLFSLTGTGNPAYLVVNAIDRDEYTAAATQETGRFSGNGHTLGLSSDGSDGREAGIVYSWQASTQSYVNATYGSLSQLDWTDSTSAYDVTNISLFGASNVSLAQSYASSIYGLAQVDAGGYLGSVTFASDNGYSAPAASLGGPANATPDGVAAAAMAMAGKAWNQNGCWVLASTIAAEAGSGLPVQSTMLGLPGAANGPWYVLYNGPAGASGNWQNLVAAGDMVAFQTSATSGHITTCVSGAGASAELVDNITYVNGNGTVTNPAHDGSSEDILIAAPHTASQEFNGVAANSVVIYALDTPAVHDLASSESVGTGGKLALSGLFSVADPLHKTITGFQVYLTSAAGSLQENGRTVASSASVPVSVNSLSQLTYVAGTLTGSEQIEIRASNGLYWGDWQSLSVTGSATHGITEHKLATVGHIDMPLAHSDLLPLFHGHF